MEPAEAVLRFLSGVGPGSEAEFYLRLFRSRARESFAAIVFDPDTWRENADGVALDLRLLATLSLTPVVVLGFYRPEHASEYARILAAKLSDMGVASSTWDSNASREAIAASAARGEIPLLQLREREPELRERELARTLASLNTHKLIFLRNEGWLSAHGRPLSVVNLSDEFQELMSLPELSAEQKRLLSCSRNFVQEVLPHELLVTITSPLSLLHELFTVKGAGTLLRRGARILHHTGLKDIDADKLWLLLEHSFGRPLRAQALEREFSHVYVEEHYRGAALLIDTPIALYLSKFAVTRQAQGEGIGRDLWQAMLADHPRLFWRARPDNPIRPFYERQCDARVRAGEWVVYAIGVAPEHIAQIIDYALAQPADF
jgi:GNAT superfamily N-acetyltransferase